MTLFAEFEARNPPRAGKTLVVGSRIYGEREDRRLRYADALGVDMIHGIGVDYCVDLSEPDALFCHGPFDHVDCISVLEHCERPWIVAQNIEERMNSRATLILSVPFVWWVHSYPSDYWRMTTEAVRSIFPRIRWRELVYAHTSIAEAGKIPSLYDEREHRYFARTEVFGAGVKM